MNKKILLALLMPFMLLFSAKAASYTYLGLVGDATTLGWVPQGISMKKSADGKIFTYTGPLKTGSFKVHTIAGDWCDGDWIMPATNGQAISNTNHITFTGCGTDNTWQVTPADAGIYTITINVETMSISFVKSAYYPNLYLVGSATPGGWSLDNATALTVDGGNAAIFTYTGNLVQGSFKIATNLTFNENYPWLHPAVNAQNLSSTDAAIVISGGSSTDYQWAIGAGDEGTYTVTVNLSGVNPTVQLVKTGPLPLNFISFSAKLNALSSKTTLNWITSNEVNTSVFVVEKNVNGNGFVTLGSVDTKNTAGTHYYTFEDKNAITGVAYYRLKQVDNDGKYTYSNIATVKNNAALALTIYPNPSANYINIAYPVAVKDVQIYNTNGQKVLSASSAGTINIKELAAGYYTVIVNDGTNKTFGRFVKQ